MLADENTSRRFVSACRRLVDEFPIIHIAAWHDGSWLGLDDSALLMACAEHRLVLVAFDLHDGSAHHHGPRLHQVTTRPWP